MAEFLTSWLDISRQPKLNPNTELKVKDIIRREVTLTYYFVRPSVRPFIRTFIFLSLYLLQYQIQVQRICIFSK